jgi:hypothetical protein
MSRNPHKTRCQVPGCKNWAMRGHTHCRPHRDAELGPRGAGAPPDNLNALRTGHDAHPLSPGDLDQLVLSILGAPDRLPHHLDLAIQSIHRRCHDPVKTLLALQALLPVLLSRVAGDLFLAEFHALREQLPPARRGSFERIVWKYALYSSPARRLDLLHQIRRRIESSPEALSSPTPPVPDSDGHDAA